MAPSAPTTELLQATIDMIPDPVFVKDLGHRWVVVNKAFCGLLGLPAEEILGKSDPDFFPPEQVQVFWAGDDEVVRSGEPFEIEEPVTGADGVVRTSWTRKWPVRGAGGAVVGTGVMIIDITRLKERRDEVARLEGELQSKLEIIEAQGSLLEQLAVPVIQIWDGILLLPLAGVIDSRRAGQVLESMLESIGRAGAEIVILDITGVPVVDTSVASYLLRSMQAAQLLGCRSVLVGISPEIAQTLVGLGVDFSKIVTRATLQNGLEYGLQQLSYRVSR